MSNSANSASGKQGFEARDWYGTRVSKTRDASLHYSFKRCLTKYIQPLYTAILHIPSSFQSLEVPASFVCKMKISKTFLQLKFVLTENHWLINFNPSKSNFLWEMLTNALKELGNNPFKENFYGKRNFIFHKSGVKTFLK